MYQSATFYDNQGVHSLKIVFIVHSKLNLDDGLETKVSDQVYIINKSVSIFY